MHTSGLVKGTHSVGGKDAEVVDWPVGAEENLVVPYGVDKIEGGYQGNDTVQPVALPQLRGLLVTAPLFLCWSQVSYTSRRTGGCR